MSRVLALAITAAALSGCLVPEARSPATGARATGEPLEVIDDTRVVVSSTTEKTDYLLLGEYRDRTALRSTKVWYLEQGDARLADEDFFRIAGDRAALSATERMRERGRAWNRRGKILAAGGVAAMVGGFFVPSALARTLLISGGVAGLSGGWVVAFWGARQMAPEVHAVDRSVADRAARDYNQRLGVRVGLGLSRSF